MSAVGCVRRLKHFNLDFSSSLLLLRGPMKTTLSLYGIDVSVYQIDLRCVSKRLHICIETTSICIEMTCIETTLYRNNRTPSLREPKFSVATYSRQFNEKHKPALLGKHKYSSVAIHYKVAGYVEETVVKIYLHL